MAFVPLFSALIPPIAIDRSNSSLWFWLTEFRSSETSLCASGTPVPVPSIDASAEGTSVCIS